MRKYVCGMCGWVYDPQSGLPASGIQPGTAFEDLPDDFVCPVCDAPKTSFLPQEPHSGGGPAAGE